MRGWPVFWVATCLAFLAGAAIPGDPSAQDSSPAHIDMLIRQLGDEQFTKREAAARELGAIGEPAAAALRKAALTSDNPEIQRRAQSILRIALPAERKSKTTDLPLVLINAGEFQMGSPATEKSRRADEAPHAARISRPFYLGAYEVTQGEFQRVMGFNPSWFADAGGGKDKVAGKDTTQFPVERVSWFDAIEFCNRLSKQDGYKPYYEMADAKREKDSIKSARVTIAGGNGYRLASELEWEYACRAETTTPFHFGKTSTGKEANFKSLIGGGGAYGAPPKRIELGRTAQVGSYPPNRWGLYDMHGNAAEWCWDWYGKDFYANAPALDPTGPQDGQHRVVRGGSWLLTDSSCRSASRFFHTPDETSYYSGFRVCRTP